MQRKLFLSDKKMLNKLIRELKTKGYRFTSHKKLIYEKPFSSQDFVVIDSILNCVKSLEDDELKLGLLYTLGVQGFHDAVPFIVEFYKKYLNEYKDSNDERILQILCNILYEIKSEKHIELYKELLTIKIVPATVGILDILVDIYDDSIDNYVIPLIEKENEIPLDWIGWPNETDKYWFSENALIFIINKKRKEHKPIIEKFLEPERLEFISFSKSKYQKSNYMECYKRYKSYAEQALRNFDNKKKIKPKFI